MAVTGNVKFVICGPRRGRPPLTAEELRALREHYTPKWEIAWAVMDEALPAPPPALVEPDPSGTE